MYGTTELKTKWFDYPIDNFVRKIFDKEDVAEAETATVAIMQFPAGDVTVDIALTIEEKDGSLSDVDHVALIDGVHYDYEEAWKLFNKKKW